ncbi:TIGR03757 family integrating conjugative element protein [Entomomonas sp. E2T0]|uniref:TIGR03757 family integrating conjugative element protein n=1 Tax=Entomomonas sp. E2T0 TaxID=2930213 RepID=UPI0022284E48|nr:TIGR03757 family integrating conjugative element protein [Entomomonas sp. E2T0]UYZ83044.1 TIGR03757 family integrating conjugative element protein [Entomomonas sp. E2T0]
MVDTISPLKPIHLIVLALLSVFMNILSYADTVIFTDQSHPVSNTGKHAIIYLDTPSHIEAKLSEGLSNDPVEAKQQALQRIQDPNMQHQLMNAYIGLSKAWQLGVTKLPAVVVDEQYVVYGINDVNQAIQLVKQYKE